MKYLGNADLGARRIRALNVISFNVRSAPASRIHKTGSSFFVIVVELLTASTHMLVAEVLNLP